MSRLLLVGLDGAGWRLLNPLLDGGGMPRLAALVEGGAMGDLYHPPPLVAAMRWTTLATGVPPERHGILARTLPGETAPRGAQAIWNILERNGARVHVVGWPAAHPAECLNGVAVSPLFAWPSVPVDARWPIAAGSVAPARLAGPLAELRVHPGDLTGDDLLGFVPRLAEIDQRTDRRLLPLAGALAETITFHGAATWILEHEPWDFLAVCYPLLGALAASYLRFAPPRLEGVSQRDAGWFGGVVAAGCRFLDQLLGRLLDLAGPDTFVMVVAPQAALGGAERPGLVEGEGPDFWVRPHGLFCLTGPGIRKDALVYGAQALDVVPTILACRGLPAALDMPGRVLAEAFEQAPGLERVETWEPDAAPRGEPSLAEEAIRALAELGYTDPLAGRQPAQSDAPLHLAWVHLVAGRGASAVELLEPLARSGPPSGMLSVCLAWGYLLCGRLEECRGALDAAPAQGRALVRMVRGLLLFREGRTPEALAALEAVERDDAGQPALLAMAGEIYRGAGRLDEAERCYRAALSRDPDLAAAHLGRAHLLLAWNEAEASAEAALAAVRVRYDLAPAHLVLGMALARMGMAEQAATALETCLKLEPGNRVAREWLSRRARRRKAQ